MNARLVRLGSAVTIAAGAVAIAAWVWRCFCVFPWLLWNELRLEPSFLVASGGKLYPAPGTGPVTTWIYGPIPALLYLPATLGRNAAEALMTAAGINLLIVVGTVVLACATWPAPTGWRVTRSQRVVSILLCLAIWPASSLQYIQADNAAVMLGLLGNLLLVGTSGHRSPTRWLAALATIAAIGCKQTGAGVLIAQIAWLGWNEGWSSAVRHSLRALACGVGFAGAFIVAFGREGLWLHLVAIPSQLPWAPSPFARFRELAPHLAVHILAPAIFILLYHRRAFARGSALSLATLSWLTALPLGLAAIFKIGGTINSLHGLLYLLPPALVTWWSYRRDAVDHVCRTSMAAAALGIAVIRLTISPAPSWSPITAHLRQGDALAAQLPGEVWFPWNPLITYYREGRLDHVEDGLQVHLLAGLPLSAEEITAFLPPHWSMVARLTNSAHWGLATELAPPEHQTSTFGNWTLQSWVKPTETPRSRGGYP
jgi:hypothetical protein